ncbi:MAG TPA: cytochrome c peroxidase [Kofleriaceae bacterium]
MRLLGGFVALSLVGCVLNESTTESELSRAQRDALIQSTRDSIAFRGVTPVPAAPNVRPALFRLGQALIFDKLLSGNRDTSCMTCHPVSFASADGRHLSMGVTGVGSGPARTGDFAQGEEGRNAPPFWNLHVMPKLFWDGRVEQLANGFVKTPGDAHITPAMRAVFEFGAISALPMFPVTARDEMRGFGAQNELSQIDDSNLPAIWNALMARLGAIPRYRQLFEAAYPGTSFNDMTFAHAANAIGGFIVGGFEARNSDWDQFLEGDNKALKTDALIGAEVFMRTCVNCHSGPVGSDLLFHNTALAQFGPGPRSGGNGPSGVDDFGRERVTGLESDRFAFRTTPLRNVEFTAPFGHTGEIVDLRDFIDHYSQHFDANGNPIGAIPGPAQNLREYDVTQIDARLQPTLLDNVQTVIDHIDPLFRTGSPIRPEFVDPITAFMLANTDDDSIDDSMDLMPATVPSGLPVSD